MPTTNSVMEEMTITLPHELVEMVRAKVTAGEFASESEFFESKLIESVLQSVNQDDLAAWMDTEGARRLSAMKAQPSLALDHEAFWAKIEADRVDDPNDVSS